MIFGQPEKKFKLLYEEYHSMVRAVLYNMTGEAFLQELVQESFLKIWKGLPQFDFRSSVKTWVYRVTVNVALDHLRKNSTAKSAADGNEGRQFAAASFEQPPERTLEQQYLQSEEQRLIQQALLELSIEERSVLVLFYFEELKVEEVAKVLNLPSGTVKSRLFKARENLREALQRKGVRYE